jgi:hypothetical protein
MVDSDKLIWCYPQFIQESLISNELDSDIR